MSIYNDPPHQNKKKIGIFFSIFFFLLSRLIMACRFHFLNENILDFFGDDDDDDAIALQYNDREIHPHSEHFMCIFNR